MLPLTDLIREILTYWNYLGWADPYSDPAFSARQRAYSQALHEGVYTPQMIVNGRHAFVGSDAETARRVLAKALRQPATVTLAVGVSPVTAEGVLLWCTWPSSSAGCRKT